MTRRVLLWAIGCTILAASCGGESNTGGTDTGGTDTPNPSGPGGPTTTTTRALEVRRYLTAIVTDARVDQILGEATRLLQEADTPDDVPCDIALVRDGAVTSFSEGDGAVDTEEEFRDYLALPGNVKVINEINWCGGYKPNIIGCAATPGDAMVVVRYLNAYEAILWAHEYGHNKGAPHRNEAQALMHETIGFDHKNITEGERTLFLK